MSLDTFYLLEELQCVAKRWASQENARLIQNLRQIEREYRLVCVLAEKDLSWLYHYLDKLQRVEEEYGSFRVFSDNNHLLQTANRIQQGCYSFRIFVDSYLCFHANKYPSLEGPDVTSSLYAIEDKCQSFYTVLNRYNFIEEYHLLGTLKRIEEDLGSARVFSDQYLSKSSHLLQTLLQTEAECYPFCEFLAELQSKKSDLLQSLQHIEHVWGSFRKYSDELQSKISNVLETTGSFGEECGSFLVFLETYLSAEDSVQRLEYGWAFPVDQFMVLKRDFKFLRIILNLQNLKDEPNVLKQARALIQRTERNIVHIGRANPIYEMRHIRREFHETKSKIRRTRYSFPEMSFQLFTDMYGIVIPHFVMEFIDTVVENLSDLLKYNDPSSLLCIGEAMMGQIEKALEGLKFLRSFLCFVSDRCIEPQRIYFSQPHFTSELRRERIQPIDPSICKIYIGVLQALKLVQSQWYPVIQIKYIVDCEVGFVDTLLHSLKELPVPSNFTAIKKTLQEMLNFLKTNIINLPVRALVFHLQYINSVIVDVGLLVYSLNYKENDKEDETLGEANQVLVLDFPGRIQSMQAMIYLISRKLFLFQYGIDEQGTADFTVDILMDLLCHYSNSISFIKSQLQKTQKEFMCFQVVVEQDDRCRQFATRVIDLERKLEYVTSSSIDESFPDWCLVLWILHTGADIRLLMAEVAEILEKNVLDLVLHNTKDADIAHSSSQHARNPAKNEEMVGHMDVMDELRGKLTEGSSSLDVISIVGMPGVGKTTLANNLYFDQSVVFRFDIRAQCCVSQEYSRKGLLLSLLGDITENTTKLEGESEDVLADKLRKLLMFKRYLIFIDDIWEASVWDDLNFCFRNANNGSRIILTTRHYDIASYAKHVSDPLVLRLLSNEESWILLQNKVFNTETCPLALEDVGKSIAQKCGGLPLSIVLVAGILAKMEKERHRWEQVTTKLSQHIQDLSEHTIDLSYQDLPHHLRTCFLYFAVFSEDEEIQVSKLTWLWISEGFVKTHMEKLLEDIAEDYMDNLVERNLVMVSKRSFDGKIKACHIHDLIKGNEVFHLSHVFPPKYKTPQCLSLQSQCNNVEKWCLWFSHVKSFQFREARKIAFSLIDHASYIFNSFKFLRVLDLEFTIIDFLPQELTLLRYLVFRTAKDMLLLPANLWNLETLIVQGMNGRVSLPDTIWKMVKLRHLHIYDQAFFTLNSTQEISESTSKMDDLQTLASAYFSCMDNADKILAKMPNLRKLRCEVLKFTGSFTAFMNLAKLKMLKISSGPTFTLINQLKIPSHLKKLTLSNFRINLNEVTTLSNLQVLKLLGVTISSNTWVVNDGQFGKLKCLKLENLSFSEWDVSDDAFPCLEHLVLKRCRYLEGIPSCFGYMSSLKSIEVKSCKGSLAESATVIKEMQVEEMGYSAFEVFIHK
ncbi:putative late blight resistance protein R1B-23 isoform X1 [Capsicum chacoense]